MTKRLTALTRRAMAIAGVVPALLVVPPDATFAQERSAPPATLPESHRFFDAPNIALTGIEATALLADGVYTQRALQRYPDIFREADPIARPFVTRGWPGQIAGGALFIAADAGLRYWLHRKQHHRVERLLPLVLTVYGAVGAVHGARELRRVETGRR